MWRHNKYKKNTIEPSSNDRQKYKHVHILTYLIERKNIIPIKCKTNSLSNTDTLGKKVNSATF